MKNLKSIAGRLVLLFMAVACSSVREEPTAVTTEAAGHRGQLSIMV